jgi:ATP synthase protein I
VTAVTVPEARRLAFGIVLGQLVMTGVVALICWMFFSAHAAWSAALGGGISTVASLAMTTLSFRHGPGTDAQTIARGFYTGEATKLAITVVLIILAIKTLQPQMAAMFAGYIATLFVFWIALANALPSFTGKAANKRP